MQFKRKLKRVGFVGWRGMVGSALLERMLAEDDFAFIEQPVFHTTSQPGQPGPDIGRGRAPLADAMDLEALGAMDAIVTCQGGGYTAQLHPALRQAGWNGFWIDAASTLRMAAHSTIILDPVNMPVIERSLAAGGRDFIGGNCTVSLMLMALAGLFNADAVEWMTVTTYQAASGGGARQMRELVRQMGMLHADAGALLADEQTSILDLDRQVNQSLNSDRLPKAAIGWPLAGSLLPWIDADLGGGVSREEWKGMAETNKILDRAACPVPIESACLRIGAMRCHSQAFTIKLRRGIAEDEIAQMIEAANPWTVVVPNEREASLARLTPAAVTGTLDIAVGRIRRLAMGPDYVSLFTVGDQLLWGAAEPLRRMLRILVG